MNIRKATPEDLEIIQQLNWPFSETGKEKYRSAILDKYTLIALDFYHATNFAHFRLTLSRDL